jgi:hypothetical protein
MRWDNISELRPSTGLLFIPVMVYESGPPVEWYWQRTTEWLRGKPVPVPLCPLQIPHGLTRTRTRTSALRGWRLTPWAMALTYIWCNIATEINWVGGCGLDHVAQDWHQRMTRELGNESCDSMKTGNFLISWATIIVLTTLLHAVTATYPKPCVGFKTDLSPRAKDLTFP